MGKDYAVYVRVSTDKDEQVSSIENQIDICRNWLERNGFEWDENCVYKDEGISGTIFLDRPAIQLILEKAKKKEIKMAVFKSISRLARDLKDSLEIREVLLAHGVRIISVEEGYDSNKAGKNDMSFELWSMFSAQYSRTISAGVSASLAAKVRRGEHIGKTPYGYNKVGGKLVIDEDEAKVVRMIFTWYNQGWGYKRIANELNRMGIPSKTSAVWQYTSIHRIIHNPLYCGDFVFNQYNTVKIGGKKKQIRNPHEQWIIFRDHHPCIISREEWSRANNQDKKKSRKKASLWNEFRGIAVCGVCGSNMVVHTSGNKRTSGEYSRWSYLKCSQYRRAGLAGCVNHAPIRYEEFRELVIGRLLEEGQSVSLNFTSDFEKRRNEELAQVKKQLNQAQTKKKGLLDLYLDHLIDKAEFEEKRFELDAVIQQCEDRIFLLENQAYTESNVRTIAEAFNALEDQNQDLYITFKKLIKQLVVHPDGVIDFEYTFQAQPVSSIGTH
ncbi:MAG: recombinase family protein [Brevibacillus sp.]|nr:recombinase family protein [Brevibacillus sp.]